MFLKFVVSIFKKSDHHDNHDGHLNLSISLEVHIR